MIADVFAPRVDVRIAGTTLAADISREILQVTCETSLDMAGLFAIVLRNADNRLLDSPLFDLGKRVEVHMGYGHDLEPMILGDITSIEPAFPESGPPTLRITGYDKSYKMRHNQPDRPAFRYIPDSLIAAQIAVENGLVPIVDPSPIFHSKELPQTVSDMAFLTERARANFFDVYVHWDTLYFQFPRPATDAVVLEWGKNLSDFAPRISSAGLAGLQVIRGYNEELAQTIVAFALAADVSADTITEKLGTAGLELLTSMGRRLVSHRKVETPLDAAVLAKSILQDILEGLYEGSGACVGMPALRAGSYVKVQGVGSRFSGTYRLRRVTHTLDGAGFRTSFEVTQRAGGSLLSLTRKFLQEMPPPHERETFHGVAVAEVIGNAEVLAAPPKVPLGRVQVRFLSLSDKMVGWARCATPMAGGDRGMFFLPEIGDEVLVAFEHGDLARPVVIGSLWNGRQLPPVTNRGLNGTRVIKTKAGHQITFEDAPGLESIVIRHKTGSAMTMDADGSITVSAAMNMTLKATGSLTIDADHVDVKVKTVMNVA